jgi:hypothetical protein
VARPHDAARLARVQRRALQGCVSLRWPERAKAGPRARI